MLGPRFPGRQVLGSPLESKKRTRQRISTATKPQPDCLSLQSARREKKPSVSKPESNGSPPAGASRLEQRPLRATRCWATSTEGNWGIPGAWENQEILSEYHMATAPDDTETPVLAGGNLITHTAGTDTVRSATSRSNLFLSGGIPTVTGTDGASSHAPVSLRRGTVADAKLTAGSTLTRSSSGGNLTGDVTVAAIAILDATENIDGGQDDVYATRDLTDDGLSDLGPKNAESIAYRRDLARVGHATPNIGPELIITIAPLEHSCGAYGARVRHQRSPL